MFDRFKNMPAKYACCLQNGQTHVKKICSKYRKIFNVCLTILWILGIKGLKFQNKLSFPSDNMIVQNNLSIFRRTNY